MYEKLLDKMPACWNLFIDQFIWMEDFNNKIIHYVDISYGELDSVKEFKLPDDFVIEDPLAERKLDFLIQ